MICYRLTRLSKHLQVPLTPSDCTEQRRTPNQKIHSLCSLESSAKRTVAMRCLLSEQALICWKQSLKLEILRGQRLCLHHHGQAVEMLQCFHDDMRLGRVTSRRSEHLISGVSYNRDRFFTFGSNIAIKEYIKNF